MTKTRGIVEAGAEYRVPAGLFQGMTLESVSGPAFEITENGAVLGVGQTIGSGAVLIRRAADGNTDDSAFVLTEPGDGSGGADGRGIATVTVSAGKLVGTYTDGASWDAGTLPAATVSVGTVTTLAAGAQATVTNRGTSSAAVLDFGIPKGADGTGGGNASAGLPLGGTAGQVLTKRSGTDGDAGWADAASGGGGSTVSLQYIPGAESNIHAAVNGINTGTGGSFATGGGLYWRVTFLDNSLITVFDFKIGLDQNQSTAPLLGCRFDVYDGNGTTGRSHGARVTGGTYDITQVWGSGGQLTPTAITLDNPLTPVPGQEYVVVVGTDIPTGSAPIYGATYGGFNQMTATGMMDFSVGIQSYPAWQRWLKRVDTPKGTVNALDPIDFPRSTPTAAPNRSGFMVVDDAAKTASLYWKFSDGTTKKIDLA